jgi:lipopolysaccharide biosynthesis glycosyltransferase
MNVSLAMDIVTSCDESFLPHAATMLCSLLENNTAQIRIHLIHDGILKQKIRRLRQFVLKYGAAFDAIEIHDSEIESLKTTNAFPIPTYFRLLIPEILPTGVSKVLYLDCDLIVRKPIDALWNIDLHNHLLAAVEDKVSDDYKEKLGLSPNSPYFNSGVLLINLDQWRRQSFHRKVVDFIKNNPEKITYPDQDGLNVVVDGKWIQLPTNWNVQHTYFFEPGSQIRFADIIADPEIVHFTGVAFKPWQVTKFYHPFSSDYKIYRQKTPWNKYQLESYPPKNIKQRIKDYLKTILLSMASYDFFWNLNTYFYRAASIIYSARKKTIKRAVPIYPPNKNFSVVDEIRELLPNQIVFTGPFKGMKYPELEAIGSSIAPKLFGTYEAELNEIVEEIIENKYSIIIDIGCAEGYYAVGFAMRMKDAIVYAFDINKKARELCQAMVNANSVSDRVHVKEYFTMRNIQELNPNEQGVIICDCEGAEEYIFYRDGENWHKLIDRYDLLIETHDIFQPGISNYLYDLFSESHGIQIIHSVNDLLRPKLYNCSILSDKSSDIKVKLMAEQRKGTMEWFYMIRKKPQAL